MDNPISEFSKLSIIIPIFNEKDTLAEILNRVQSVSLSLDKEIILVDDCSTDGTRQLLEAELQDQNIVKVYHSINQGKGAAVRSGMSRQ